MLRFFKGLPRRYVWDYERKGNTLVEFHLSIKETNGFGLSQTESLKNFHGLPLQASINTSIDTARRRDPSGFSHVPSTPVIVLMKDDAPCYSVGWLKVATFNSPFSGLARRGSLDRGSHDDPRRSDVCNA